ncbi:uncharacterized protein LTR77_009201 [Saxophila tyrrhenica]|uniref:Uncharacterized protein n=1 Tax=Saxophila tyrrhenica TaxID=1690608 RepID=A0AAV9NYE1_9PEZI|nr:hypothetical protein LTR77_009201 [Saxophila tyrrhenica]
MLYADQQLDLRDLVHQQYSYYARELGNTHKALSTQYMRLAELQKKLDEREERQLSRKVKKKTQWSRALTKKAIESLESQQAWLYAYLCQCYYVLSTYESDGHNATPTPPGFDATTMPIFDNRETYGCTTPAHFEDTGRMRYWDHSMMTERRMSSPYGSSTDLGFFESPTHHPLPWDSGQSLLFPNVYQNTDPWSGDAPRASLSTLSSSSERDVVPEMINPAPPPSTMKPRKRRYSENAIQLIESRLPATKTHRRGQSVDHISASSRTLSVGHVAGEFGMIEKR